jgi:hypothetical protein
MSDKREPVHAIVVVVVLTAVIGPFVIERGPAIIYLAVVLAFVAYGLFGRR